MTEEKRTAARAIACLDLTNLNDDCDADAVRDLCRRAQTPHGNVAAVCIWPEFVTVAHEALMGTGIRIATVVNFPGGDQDAATVQEMTRKAVTEGADEIDMVIPYKGLIEGHPELIPAAVGRVCEAAAPAIVKAILETGVLGQADLIRKAARLAIEGGADFLKTSTGKVPVNATPEAARILLEEIRDADRVIGFKAAGGVRSTQDAAVYLDLCDEIMGPDWVAPAVFRFGASSVLDALLATLDDAEAPAEGQGY